MPAPARDLSLIEYGIPGQNASAPGRGAVPLLFVRVLAGAAAMLVAVLNGVGHTVVVRHAATWSLPLPSITVWLGTLLLLVLGLGLVLGLASRFCALGVLVIALVTIVTAGRSEGGAPLYGTALLAIGCLIIVARGGGAPQLLDRVDPRAW